MNKFLIAVLALLVCATAWAADGFSSLEEQMSGSEFTAAGLDKLTPGELASLNAWLRAHSVATLGAPAAASAAPAASAVSADRRGFKDEDERTPITSRILGNFSGWDGQTVFKLENGMIWVQSDKDKFYVRETQNAVAIIEPGMFGVWRLRVDGYDEKCKVKRIQ